LENSEKKANNKKPEVDEKIDDEDLPPDEMSPPNLKPNMTQKNKNKE